MRVAHALAPGHERSVDLELVDLERVQVAERRVTGAEIVDRQPEAEGPQLADALDRLEALREQRALGDLEGEIPCLHAGPGEGGDDHGHETGVAELPSREVHVQAQVRPVVADLPGADAATALRDDPAADRQDLARLLGKLDELAGKVE